MPTYVDARQQLGEIWDRLLEKPKFRGLADVEITCDMLFAHAKRDANGDAVGPALRHHGYAAAATIRIVPYRDRVAGAADTQLIVDGDRWDEWSERRQEALIAHELTHIEMKLDKNGAVKRDDAGRPALKMRLHDAEVGVFYEVIEEYGDVCIDHEVCRELHRQLVQREFDFGDGESKPKPRARKAAGDAAFHNEVKDFLDDRGIEYEENVKVAV